jgi:hypothetical protein
MNTPQVGDQPARNDSDALLRQQKATAPVVGAQQITFLRNIERIHIQPDVLIIILHDKKCPYLERPVQPPFLPFHFVCFARKKKWSRGKLKIVLA